MPPPPSWLTVPVNKRPGSAPPASIGGVDRVAADIVVAQARTASKLASQTGALRAYLDFEKATEEKRAQGRRPVHNERFLGNTLKQVDAHNRRVPSAGSGHASERVGARGEATASAEPPSSRPTKIKVVFEKAGTLGIFFEQSSRGDAVIKAIRPGGLAEARPELRPGMVLAAVQGVKVSSLGYMHALDLMKGSERPLSLKFRDPAAKEAKQRLKQRRKEQKRERKRRRSGKHKASKRHRGDARHSRSRSCSSHSDSPEVERSGTVDARRSGRPADSTPFAEGERVIYCGQDGQEQEVVIVSVDTNVASGEEPFVAVRMPSGSVRDTTFARLREVVPAP